MPHPAIKSVTFQRTLGGYAVGDIFRHRTLGECQVQKIDDESLIVVSATVSSGNNNTYRLTPPRVDWVPSWVAKAV
jgi:hypothetical protein